MRRITSLSVISLWRKACQIDFATVVTKKIFVMVHMAIIVKAQFQDLYHIWLKTCGRCPPQLCSAY